MVDAVGDFKMFSEFMSPGGKFKQIFVLAVPLNAYELGSMARLLRSPSLASLLYASSFFARFCHPAMIVLKKIAATTPQLSHANRVFKFCRRACVLAEIIYSVRTASVRSL